MYGGMAGKRRYIFMLTVVWHLVRQNNTEHLATQLAASKSMCIVLTQSNPLSKTGSRPE